MLANNSTLCKMIKMNFLANFDGHGDHGQTRPKFDRVSKVVCILLSRHPVLYSDYVVLHLESRYTVVACRRVVVSLC